MGKKQKKGPVVAAMEYAAFRVVLQAARWTPSPLLRFCVSGVARMGFQVMRRRREIAIANIRAALGDTLSENDIEKLARKSFHSFALTLPELVKHHDMLTNPEALTQTCRKDLNVSRLFDKARQLHDEFRGCIFVTPHIGNWELLPYVSHVAGIPMVVVVRPLDNQSIEKVLFTNRTGTGQVFIPKRNSLMPLQRMLRMGKSIGMLPDQSTYKGLSVPFFNRPALTTPIPALLAVQNMRPLVVTACCRNQAGGFDGWVSDPILPQSGVAEREELCRLTTAMNAEMEAVIRRYPEQYFWMHNRWKVYT